MLASCVAISRSSSSGLKCQENHQDYAFSGLLLVSTYFVFTAVLSSSMRLCALAAAAANDCRPTTSTRRSSAALLMLQNALQPTLLRLCTLSLSFPVFSCC